MEIDEIKVFWKEEDRRISESVRVNKNASLWKLRTSFDKIRVRRLFRLILSCIAIPLLFALVVLPRLKNDNTAWFYLTLVSFIVPIVFFWGYYIYYYLSLLRLNVAESLLKVQKEVLCLEGYDKILNWLGLIIVPIVTLSAFKIFGMSFRQETIFMMVLIALIMVASFIARLKVIIPKEYSYVKTLLQELEEAE